MSTGSPTRSLLLAAALAVALMPVPAGASDPADRSVLDSVAKDLGLTLLARPEDSGLRLPFNPRGWSFFGLENLVPEGVGRIILKMVIFASKMGSFIVFYMLIRWTLPRFRFDQLMGLAWKVLIPLAMCNLLLVIVVKHTGLPLILLFPASIGLLIGAAYLKTLMPEEPPAPNRSLRARQV